MSCALVLIENSTLVAAAAANVPLVMETETQSCVLVIDQSRALPPELVNVQTKLEGLNGPPWMPMADSWSAGKTAREPGATPLSALNKLSRPPVTHLPAKAGSGSTPE